MPSAIAAVVALIASGAVWGLNHLLGWDQATSRYIASLEGLVKARDAEIVDLKQEVVDLQLENRALSRQVRELALRLDAIEQGRL